MRLISRLKVNPPNKIFQQTFVPIKKIQMFKIFGFGVIIFFIMYIKRLFFKRNNKSIGVFHPYSNGGGGGNF
jgi:hypothetical protein